MSDPLPGGPPSNQEKKPAKFEHVLASEHEYINKRRFTLRAAFGPGSAGPSHDHGNRASRKMKSEGDPRDSAVANRVDSPQEEGIAQRLGIGKENVKAFDGFGDTPGADPKEKIFDTVGLAISGGGIRSASFSLGVLQALDLAGALPRVDYLSTVSGGGYVGSSLTCFGHFSGGEFPFRAELGVEPPSLRHVRDHSNYLIPHGAWDVLVSTSIYLRGLAANILLVLPWLLFAAAMTIFLNPTLGSLTQPLLAHTLFGRLAQTVPFATDIAPYVIYLAVTAWLALLLLLSLVVWSLLKSSESSETKPEVPGRGSNFLSVFFIVFAVSAFCAIQPYILAEWVFPYAKSLESSSGSLLATLAAGATAFASIVGLYGNKLTWLVKQASNDPTYSAYAKGISSKVLLYAAAAVVPLILWGVYLLLCYCGIANTENIDPNWPADYGHTPQWLKSFGIWLTDGAAPDDTINRYPIGFVYLVMGIILAALSALLKPNANSLHRLYRDRLATTFLFKRKVESDKSPSSVTSVPFLALSKLNEGASPYHLINTALNIQRSRYANQRGRDADFFLLSRNYVGSGSTGYVKTAELEKAVPALDLGTGMAISGAAAASNMGSTAKQWKLSLALLNVRLGYWLRNPKTLHKRSFRNWLAAYINLYFLYEITGRLDENQNFVYLTDGGHIENLGLYELLRRRCCLIIVIDGEADPKMNFNSFIKVARYARIDLGTRIDLPWQAIRKATLETDQSMLNADKGVEPKCEKGPHCAIGTIYYPGGQGLLLYVKSSVTGDESDYVLDYKRRNPSFPHETTSDQFFSEEQFEVYRNLGFHAMRGFFSEEDFVARATASEPPGVAPAAAAESGTATSAGLSSLAATDLRQLIRDVLNYRKQQGLPATKPQSVKAQSDG